MVSPLKYGFSVSGFNSAVLCSNPQNTNEFCQFKSNILGKPLILSDQDDFPNWRSKIKSSRNSSVRAQGSMCVSTSMRWWEKTLKPNMIEIHSAQQLVDSLCSSGDRLVIIDFYSPACGGCRSLHPKICAVAESYPDAIFLKVNYEQLKSMCHCLHIHVLPFFRFYRGSEGRLCSFSCTNATINKLKDAMVKHGADRCGIGPPAKGLNESEILTLSSAGLLPHYSPLQPDFGQAKMEELIMKSIDLSGVWSVNQHHIDLKQETTVIPV